MVDEGNVLAMHPTVKPVALVADAILGCSARGDTVLDSFLGAGGTLLAAERTGRVCYGMEIEPKVCRPRDPQMEVDDRRRRATRGHGRKFKQLEVVCGR